jgi:hypothetical protein
MLLFFLTYPPTCVMLRKAQIWDLSRFTKEINALKEFPILHCDSHCHVTGIQNGHLSSSRSPSIFNSKVVNDGMDESESNHKCHGHGRNQTVGSLFCVVLAPQAVHNAFSVDCASTLCPLALNSRAEGWNDRLRGQDREFPLDRDSPGIWHSTFAHLSQRAPDGPMRISSKHDPVKDNA